MISSELLIAGGGFFIAIFMYIIADSYSNFSNYNPSFWPKLILIGMIFCFVLIAKKEIKRRTNPEANPEPISEKESGNSWKAFIVTIGILLAYISSINFLGFFFPTTIFTWLMLRILGEKKGFRAAVFSIVFSFTCTIFFTKILLVPLPGGVGIFERLNFLFL